MRIHLWKLSLIAALSTMATAPAQAGDVTFTGVIANSCVLNLSTPGVVAPSTDGTVLASDVGGGVAATLSVVAVGTAPTLAFGAPALTTPTGYSGNATAAIRYTSAGGANQAYTSTASTARSGTLLDTFTINSRVTGAGGFASGTYNVRTVVTCQQ